MLIKLMRHEFRATGRVMGPVFLLLLAAAVGANVSLRVLFDLDHWLANLVGGLLMAAFVVAIIGVCMAAWILMIYRFYKNLLQDEGYVMLTLPVSIHEHIWTKLIVSAVWFAATILAVGLACLLAFGSIEGIVDFFQGFWSLIRESLHLKASDMAHVMGICVELLALCFIGSCASCLQFYGALAIGHSAASHKLAWSVAAYLVISFVMQLISGILMFPLNHLDLDRYFSQIEGFGAIHLMMWIMIVVAAVYGAVFYVVTCWFMRNRLNLE